MQFYKEAISVLEKAGFKLSLETGQRFIANRSGDEFYIWFQLRSPKNYYRSKDGGRDYTAIKDFLNRQKRKELLLVKINRQNGDIDSIWIDCTNVRDSYERKRRKGPDALLADILTGPTSKWQMPLLV